MPRTLLFAAGSLRCRRRLLALWVLPAEGYAALPRAEAQARGGGGGRSAAAAAVLLRGGCWTPAGAFFFFAVAALVGSGGARRRGSCRARMGQVKSQRFAAVPCVAMQRRRRVKLHLLAFPPAIFSPFSENITKS
ncbi:uncharacterized protein LOC144327962 [Podarcis muralis]